MYSDSELKDGLDCILIFRGAAIKYEIICGAKKAVKEPFVSKMEGKCHCGGNANHKWSKVLQFSTVGSYHDGETISNQKWYLEP